MYFNICDQLLSDSLFNELEKDLFNLSFDKCYHGYNIPPWYFYVYKPKKQLTSINRSSLPTRRNTYLKPASYSSSSKRNSTLKTVPSSSSSIRKSTIKPTPSQQPSSKKESTPKTNTSNTNTISSPKETFSPKLKFNEDDANYYIYLDLPGMTKDQIKMEIDINDRFIAISGERKNNDDSSITEHHDDTTNEESESSENTSEGKKFSLEECLYGKFEKIVSIPETGNLDTIQAKLENGTLNITVEKIAPKKQTRTIQIQ